MSKAVVGTIKITSKPLGFVTPLSPDGEKQKSKKDDSDVLVFEEGLNCALDRDVVEVEVLGTTSSPKDPNLIRKTGKVIKVIERSKIKFVGTLEDGPFGLVFKPDDWKFYKKIDIKDAPPEAKAGFKAQVEMKEWTNSNLNPEGTIVSVIGQKGIHETEMQSILLDKGIIYDFPHDVEKEAEEVSKEAFDATGRKDFRGITTFTIDPKDAKDFDDALSYEELGDGKIRVGVHIADVSHFVRPGGALDREARKRSCSTYLVDRTIPMLPEILSNGLCSLNPNVDRYAFASVFDIKKETGEILSRWFGKTIINSNKRFTYEEAQEILESRIKNHELWGKNFGKELEDLNRIAKIYQLENKKNGAIEFETEEVKFELDSEGKPIRIYKKPRLDTMKMIEQWMLLANREVAKYISEQSKKRGGASLFRIHDVPKMERIENLAVFVRALGHELNIKNGVVSAKDLNLLLQQIEGHASESLIKTAAVRSMAKAVYSTKNIGHYGLAFEYYTHFTSPIRRYPDLMIHRILQNHLMGGKIAKDEIATLQKIADEASDKEITVAEAERESIRYKQVEFMQDKVGQVFDATISGVTEWGMYVEDPETKVEGMVRLKDMDGDFYELDEKNYAIVGQRTKKKFSLGDSVRVKLIASDLDRKTLDFKLV